MSPNGLSVSVLRGRCSALHHGPGRALPRGGAPVRGSLGSQGQRLCQGPAPAVRVSRGTAIGLLRGRSQRACPLPAFNPQECPPCPIPSPRLLAKAPHSNQSPTLPGRALPLRAPPALSFPCGMPKTCSAGLARTVRDREHPRSRLLRHCARRRRNRPHRLLAGLESPVRLTHEAQSGRITAHPAHVPIHTSSETSPSASAACPPAPTSASTRQHPRRLRNHRRRGQVERQDGRGRCTEQGARTSISGACYAASWPQSPPRGYPTEIIEITLGSRQAPRALRQAHQPKRPLDRD